MSKLMLCDPSEQLATQPLKRTQQRAFPERRMLHAAGPKFGDVLVTASFTFTTVASGAAAVSIMRSVRMCVSREKVNALRALELRDEDAATSDGQQRRR
eukprot:CAMPEP_0203935298 /NCGR_PEP_ID=MMETSP0359-20131031/73081_1 /ASSEMBLY_ACC=CAM_ASM_000338 /TAXON_ID=268821 /ORGANISM="Scrippsiella Hangoei, Strain SHTV-5" /LENGTH=98 /DNA_ID=CAMNT_0050865131 /DNA_START=368 /DNA_END=661 /DNA_ORIENTATION=+